MGLVFLVVLGGMLGWLAAIINRAENARGMLLNVATGVGGALLTGLVLAPLLGAGNILDGAYRVDGLLTALAGSLVVLVAVNVLRDRENAE
jgi:uncharacterized membrane protein YeaQ/YmgE (transglycosylase-associated protein family)